MLEIYKQVLTALEPFIYDDETLSALTHYVLLLVGNEVGELDYKLSEALDRIIELQKENEQLQESLDLNRLALIKAVNLYPDILQLLQQQKENEELFELVEELEKNI